MANRSIAGALSLVALAATMVAWVGCGDFSPEVGPLEHATAACIPGDAASAHPYYDAGCRGSQDASEAGPVSPAPTSYGYGY
jgi:hypothetical protein